MPVFDLENYRKNKNVLEPGEQVWISEKLHGSNSVFAWHKKCFWVSSHRVLRPTEDNSFWHRASRKYDLKNKLKPFPDLAFYAEIIGPEVQDMGYGLQFGHVNMAVFDIYNIKTGTYLNYNELVETCKLADLPMVPVLYCGPYDASIVDGLKDGPSLIGDHFREGVVVKPLVERLDRRCGRVALKLVGEVYLLRKDGSEKH
jgi:RNA ligase (TIGR02306 family)